MLVCMHVYIYACIHVYKYACIHVFMHACMYNNMSRKCANVYMGWLRLVGSLQIQVSFAEYNLFNRALLQRRPIILRSLLIVATPHVCVHAARMHTCMHVCLMRACVPIVSRKRAKREGVVDRCSVALEFPLSDADTPFQ